MINSPQTKMLVGSVLVGSLVFAAFPAIDVYLSGAKTVAKPRSAATVKSNQNASSSTSRAVRPPLQAMTVDESSSLSFSPSQELPVIEKNRDTDNDATMTDPAKLLEKGTQLVNQREPYKATQYLKRAALTPDFEGESLFNLARAEAQMGHVEQAIQFLQRAQQAGFHDILAALADRDLRGLLEGTSRANSNTPEITDSAVDIKANF